ncbi:Rho termination factor N-terminal domain-containing protein [Spirillospora sp. CA-294931]|uniref:Rho termination factor N-terminal domain-containing protein n=1 Tax=Spirillospora sp. CA-294931 TaxID=3240042 RepID=UPI003D8E08F6
MRAHRTALGALRRGIQKVGDRRKPGPPSRAPKPRTSPEEAPEPVDAGATKKHLYEVAKGLGIEGRSKMTKDELVRAIDQARRTTREPRG